MGVYDKHFSNITHIIPSLFQSSPSVGFVEEHTPLLLGQKMSHFLLLHHSPHKLSPVQSSVKRFVIRSQVTYLCHSIRKSPNVSFVHKVTCLME